MYVLLTEFLHNTIWESVREIDREVTVEIFLQRAQIPKLMQIIVVNRIIRIRNCSFDGLYYSFKYQEWILT